MSKACGEFLVLSWLLALALVSSQSAKYQKGDPVPLFANKVGPFANPSEQYEYYTLPFCAPREEFRKSQHLGEVLAGDRMMKTLFNLPFLGYHSSITELVLAYADCSPV
eukprot:746463-Hanusia_phi.AAC.12